MLARVLSLLTVASSLSLLSGCGAPAEDPALESAESAYNQSSSALGRAATLAVAEKASLGLLTAKKEDGGVGLTSSAAAAILAHRAGPDGTVGTADDGTFPTISALEALPSVGSATTERLRTFALGLTVARALPSTDGESMTLAQLLQYEAGQTIEELCSAQARYGIEYNGGGSFATWAGTWRAKITLGKGAGVALTFVEGAGLTLSGDLELHIETESVSGRWAGFGPNEVAFPRIPTLTAYSHFEPASAALEFTTSPLLPTSTMVVRHDARFVLEVVDGAFSLRGTVATRKGFGPGFSGAAAANYQCRAWE